MGGDQATQGRKHGEEGAQGAQGHQSQGGETWVTRGRTRQGGGVRGRGGEVLGVTWEVGMV